MAASQHQHQQSCKGLTGKATFQIQLSPIGLIHRKLTSLQASTPSPRLICSGCAQIDHYVSTRCSIKSRNNSHSQDLEPGVTSNPQAGPYCFLFV
eukprot:1162007-Pelagomonas_calceolata.AAC.6